MAMRISLLLLMTYGMSLRKWAQIGQLSRELMIYDQLAQRIGNVYIYSYGKQDSQYVADYPRLHVLEKPWFFPDAPFLPARIQRLFNRLYNLFSPHYHARQLAQIDIVKSNQLPGSEYGCRLKKRFHTKFVVRMGYYYGHFQPVDKSERYAEKRVFPVCDAVMSTSLEAREFLINKKGLQADNVHWIPNYVDTELFDRKSMTRNIDVLYVGRFEPQKNLFALLQAMQNMDWRICLIGKGKLKKTMEKMTQELRINATFLENVENTCLPDYYNRAKTFVLPSHYEGNPKVLLEAMACGCACIGANAPGIRNVIDHEKNGLLCEGHAAALRQAITRLVNSDEQVEAMRQAARRYVIEHCALETLMDKEVAVYRELLTS